ncbi:hypothetical protein OHC33_001800 [Knufia fluminis]|uniref:Uncharacterized protein n=1 Tax=Knufia fluminis TaxID=191047 RepID=A0AAN8IAZ8_9EURO|nr:hypothetical protein OHC33_001800 [Knufia fluminis]
MSSRVPTSSPLSSARSSADTYQSATSQSQPQYRPASPLPFELLQHIQVYLEENLFSQALRFLLSLISATTSNEKKGVPVPPFDYLAVFSTLAVHPNLTTRASNPDKLAQSNTALRLLWMINNTTGPVNASLSDAFRFRRYDDKLSTRNGSPADDDDAWRNRITITYADKDSLFNLADDFWAVVGWALNCSCLPGPHATRWNYWLPWLEYMLDTLETDWELREQAGTCDQSLLWQYIKSADGGNARRRRVLRATFADGGGSAVKEFRPIFPKELKERKQEGKQVRKPDIKVDIDEEIFGDYMEESESSTDNEESGQATDPLSGQPSKRLRTRTPSMRRKATPRASKSRLTDHEGSDVSTADESTMSSGLGPPESIQIRLRLLQLLSSVSAHPELISSAREVNWPDLHELYTLFVEFIRPLPLPVFQQFILPSKSKGLKPESRMALCEFLLQRTLDSDHTSKVSTFEPMTLDRLVQQYLPYASGKNSIEFQAKVSILLESVLRQLAKDNNIASHQKDDLLDVLEEGIETREAKANNIRGSSKYKKAANKDEEFAVAILQESGKRMKFVVEHLVK